MAQQLRVLAAIPEDPEIPEDLSSIPTLENLKFPVILMPLPACHTSGTHTLKPIKQSTRN